MKGITLSIIIWLVTMAGAYAQVDIYGYFEPQYTGLYLNDDYSQSQSNKLRVDLKSTAIENVEFGADVIYLLYFGKKEWNVLDFLPDRVTSAIPPELYPLYQFTYDDTFYLDNVYIRLANYRLALTAGKQQISLGTGYFANPTDIFNTKDALDPTYEQPGHNAIRGDLFLKHRLSVTVMYTPIAADWENSGKLMRTKAGIGHFDFSLTGYDFHDTTTDFITFESLQQHRRCVGADFVGELFGLGIWAEGIYNFIEDNESYELLVGSDYTFESGLYTLLEYHHNSLGKSDYQNYSLNDWMRFITGETKTISQDQIYGLIQYPVTDLTMVGSSVIFSVSDQSVALVPMVYHSLFENIDLTLMLNLSIGKEGKVFSSALGTGGFLRAQVYF